MSIFALFITEVGSFFHCRHMQCVEVSIFALFITEVGTVIGNGKSAKTNENCKHSLRLYDENSRKSRQKRFLAWQVQTLP